MMLFPWIALNLTHDQSTVMDSKAAFRASLESRMGMMTGMYPDENEDYLSLINIRNHVAEQVTDVRIAVDEALNMHAKHINPSLGDLAESLNHAVAVIVGFWRAVTDTPCTTIDPETVGRCLERLECFMEEIPRTALRSIGDDGLVCPVAWNGMQFVVR